MASKLERDLLALAAKQRRQNEAGEARQEPELPPLEPGMLLSANARGELEAAKAIRATAHQAQALADVVGMALPTPRVVDAVHERATVRDSQAAYTVPRSELEQPPEISMAALASLFMNREAQAQAEITGAIIGVEGMSDGMDIEFDSELPEVTVPNEAVRFRVGRDDPPPVNFRREAYSTDGRVVSQMGDDGRFHPVDEGIQPMLSPEALRGPVSPEPTYPAKAPPRQGNSAVRPVRPQQTASEPKGYWETIAGDDFLPDD